MITFVGIIGQVVFFHFTQVNLTLAVFLHKQKQ